MGKVTICAVGSPEDGQPWYFALELVVHILTYVEDAAVVKAKMLNEPTTGSPK